MPMCNDQSAGRPARREAKQSAGTEDEAKLPATVDFHRLTPAQQELLRKIARHLGILMARRDHEKAMNKQASPKVDFSE
jgi:hypothetical protein